MKAYNTSVYPVFEADQVLSQKELNSLVSHLEEQDRITRKHLTGLGIICGLELSFPTVNSIKIACGTAVTSLGFQIDLKEKEFTHYHDFEISDQFLKAEYIREPYLDAIFKYTPMYEPIKNCFELLPTEATDVNKIAIPGNFFNDNVIILLLELTLIDQKNCNTTNCDDKGKRIEFNIRPLVIPVSESTEALLHEYQLAEQYDKLTFPRYNVPFSNIVTAAQILDGFRKAYSDTFLSSISNSISNLYQDFIPVLPQNSNLAILQNSKAKIEETVNINKTSLNLQYVWDWIFDIVQAYNEIIEFKKINPALCCVDEGLFPFHVVLGGGSNDKDVYRTPFIKTLNGTNEEDVKLKELNLLFEKLALIISSFKIQEGNKIKITPSSHGKFLLSEKAIPFYYDNILDLNKKWNPGLTSKHKNDTILSYHSDIINYSNKPSVKEPLLYDIEPYNFFRIEGHIGTGGVETLNLIQNDIKNYSLDFDCILIELKNESQSFINFIKEHPAITHKAGVPLGGTFVLVSSDGNVVTDFYLSYKIPEAAKEQECCSLVECSYPWISSLKYLNNLARSIKGTQSRNKSMPQNYRLEVIEYKINGESLINRTTTLSIPLQEVFLRRMHVITETLNKRFEKGVVFDFNESQKRFVITRAKEDTYTIRFRDITLAGSNAVYTYSNNGMFRNNKVFRLDAMRCRDLKKYNPAFYQKLHDKIAPVNKDDDYGTFDEKWKRWNELKASLVNHQLFKDLKLKRMITESNQLPSEIQTKLRTLKSDFQQITEKTLQFSLDGDWVTGEWVSSAMLNYYKKNKKNTHDAVVLFVNLRKFLHNETGVTKLSIYINNEEYTKDFDEVIEAYNQFADIYFGTPTGVNAIQI